MQGLAPDGGLFMPISLPLLAEDFLKKIHSLELTEIALEIAQHFFTDDITRSKLGDIIDDAVDIPVPIASVGHKIHVAELFHGPTLAFKDFGARFMARLMGHWTRNAKQELTVLVATSGDTGSAVASGFYDVPGIRVFILYPSKKISSLQEQQITTLGGNITACEIDGTFDDCQKLVKASFVDENLIQKIRLTTANSINIARLIPQTFYYFFAVSRILKGRFENPVTVSVPSGNFGNLTAGLFTKVMGLPIARFIAATNANDIVPQYLATGKFTPRPPIQTLANAMDVGNPSNFARIQTMFGNDHISMKRVIDGYSFSDKQIVDAIEEAYYQHHYILDPHGAIGLLGLKKAKEKWPDLVGLFLETAHPAKFSEVYAEKISKAILVPKRLEDVLSKTKKSESLSARFDDWRDFLLSRA